MDKGLKDMFNVDIEYGYENSVDTMMCLKYISFNNFFKVSDKDDTSYFRVIGSHWDTYRNIKPTIIVDLNNEIDPKSASRKENYEIIVGDKEIKIDNIQVSGENLYIRLKGEDIQGKKDQCRISIRDLKDINGNILDARKSIELYQYRELFVQGYNKNMLFSDTCKMQYLPLEQNCISKYSGNYNYWMNTPENIKR